MGHTRYVVKSWMDRRSLSAYAMTNACSPCVDGSHYMRRGGEFTGAGITINVLQLRMGICIISSAHDGKEERLVIADGIREEDFQR